MDDEDEEGTTDATANSPEGTSNEGENKEAPVEAAEEKA